MGSVCMLSGASRWCPAVAWILVTLFLCVMGRSFLLLRVLRDQNGSVVWRCAPNATNHLIHLDSTWPGQSGSLKPWGESSLVAQYLAPSVAKSVILTMEKLTQLCMWPSKHRISCLAWQGVCRRQWGTLAISEITAGSKFFEREKQGLWLNVK